MDLILLPFRRVLLIAAILFWAMPCHGGELGIVKDGNSSNLLHPEKGFHIESEDGVAVLRDRWQTFVANARTGDEFTLKIRMAIEKAHRSAATVVLLHGEEWSHFGFSGSEEKMFTQGKAFTRDTNAAIKERTTPQFILDGDMFEFVLTYRKTDPGMADLDISINGESFVHQSGKCPPIDAVGLRPWISDIRVEAMTLGGKFEQGGVEPKRFDPPEKK